MQNWLDLVKKYRVEAILITGAIVLTLFSLVIFVSENKKEELPVEIEKSSEKESGKIVVEISGAVKSPGVYELAQGSRLNDALVKAGSLSAEADPKYFARNFNLSRTLNDQEKIYIPSWLETANGLFVEKAKIIELQSASTDIPSESNSGKININSASAKDLDSLPGVGEKTAEKIIENRPYSSLEELVSKKVISQSVFDQIKSSIALN